MGNAYEAFSRFVSPHAAATRHPPVVSHYVNPNPRFRNNASRAVKQHTHTRTYIPGTPPQRHAGGQQASIGDTFDRIYRTKMWGSDGGGSGLGSSVAYAAGARRVLVTLIRRLNVSSMIDAPCGAMVWQTPMLRELLKKTPHFRYLGIDVVSSVVQSNRKSVRPLAPNVKVELQNLAAQPLPTGYELIFSRDALQHNTHADTFRILRNFAASDARYLLLGSYPPPPRAHLVPRLSVPNRSPNPDIRTGEYYPIDLARPPFNLEPMEVLEEKTPDRKALYLYEREKVALALRQHGRGSPDGRA